eukprot:6476515-Amphidinium_carterae.2
MLVTVRCWGCKRTGWTGYGSCGQCCRGCVGQSWSWHQKAGARARVQNIKAHASDTTQAGVANGRADAEAKECLRRLGPCRA